MNTEWTKPYQKLIKRRKARKYSPGKEVDPEEIERRTQEIMDAINQLFDKEETDNGIDG